MQTFENKIAVVTGGGTGMGRELVRQLAAAGAEVAMCDVSEANMAETASIVAADGSASRITSHLCDVADETAVLAFRDAVVESHSTDHVHLVFNNAGLSGGGSMLTDSRESWDRCFNVCWGGVYYGTRAFLPLLVAADEAHLINTSSVNGFWASLGPDRPHTAYSAAKFAVKGFTEALVTDLAVNAPHVGVSVVMPGHIGTSIVANSMQYGVVDADLSSDDVAMIAAASKMFHDEAPMDASTAAALILDGVKEGQWRILLGDDAHALDAAVRANPEGAYDGTLMIDTLRSAGGKDV